MNTSLKFSAGIAGCLVLTLMFSPIASATDIADFTASITAANSQTQSGRLSRNGQPQDWSGVETTPLTINPTVTYNYLTFLFTPSQLGNGQFVQVEIESLSPNVFASSYLDSYNPANQQANFLGDEGSSGDFFSTNPRFFQVVVPTGNSLVLVFNTTGANGVGLGEAFSAKVENFTDTMYTDLAAVPEPSSVILLGAGATLGLGLAVRGKLRAAA